MLLFDVNFYVYANRVDNDHHELCRDMLRKVINSRAQFGYCNLALAAFVRITTNKAIFKSPNTLAQSFAFTKAIQSQENALRIDPGENHWDIFEQLCVETKAHGKFVSDCYFAALALENGCTWITTDRDFDRFKELDWLYPSLEIG